MRCYETHLWLPAEPAEVFDYFADVRHLDAMTPPWFRLEILAPSPPIRMDVGTEIEYALRWRPLPLRWRSRVTEWEPPQRFTYEQRRGPYSRWRHAHRYEARDGGTWIADRVDYETVLPWLDRYLVTPDIDRIFRYRNRYVSSIFRG